MKITLKISLYLLSLTLLCPLNGFGDIPLLFYPADHMPQIAMPAAHPLRVTRQAIIGVNLSALQSGNAQQVQLNLFDDISFTADHFITDKRGAASYAWYGRVQNKPDATIVLVVDQDRLSGVVRLPLQAYKIHPLEAGPHVVRDIPTGTGPVALFKETASSTNGTPVSAEHEVFRLTNEARAEAGLAALAWDDALFNAARGHSLDMATYNYFEHDGLDGRDPTQRMIDAGYDYIPWGENIAYGYPTPEAVMAGWMGSTGHRNNILKSSACDLGVGMATHANTHNRPYWTQNFGRFDWQADCPINSANQHPVAHFTADLLAGEAPLQVHLDGSDSYDPDGQLTGFQWDFGDGTSANGPVVQHTYTVEGSYTVRLTVVDNEDAIATHTEVDFISVGDTTGSDPGNDPGNTVGGSGDGEGSGGCFIRAAHK